MPRSNGSVLARTLLVLAIAIVLRVAGLGSWPGGFSNDEPYGLRHAARFATGVERLDLLRLYPQGGIGQQVVGGHQPGLYYLWPVTLFRLFGVSRAVWRLSSVIPSLVMVLALYPLGRRAFGERTAFLAALLLAMGRWSASEARWGWVVTAAWGLIAPDLVLFVGAWRRRRTGTAFASGLLCGIPAAFYPSALAFGLVPLPFAFLARKRSSRVLAAWGLGFAIGLLPTLVMLARQPEEFFARGRAASLLAERGASLFLFAVGNVIQYAGLLFVAGDPLPWHGVPGTPALNPIAALAALAGIAVAIRRPRATTHAFVVSVLLAGFALGVISQNTDAPNQYRIGFAALGAALAGALGLRAARVAWRRRRLPGPRALVPAALALALLLDARYLLVTWPRDPRSIHAFGEREERMARDIEAIASRGQTAAVSPALEVEPDLLDLALAKTPLGFARAGEKPDVPYVIGEGPAGAVRIEPPHAAGAPRIAASGAVLYRVAED